MVVSREKLLFLLCGALFLAGGLFGGGPTDPITSAMIELVACGVLGMAVMGVVNGECPREAYPVIALMILIAVLPILHMIPLPASIWRSLPGREVPAAISQIAGQGDLARPLSLSPEDTRMHALALIVPFATFLGVAQIDTRLRDRLILLVVAFAFVSAIFGIFQVATRNFYFYQDTHVGFPVGFFANRNHEADLMLIALPFSVRGIQALHLRRSTRKMLIFGAITFFIFAVISTQSRSALALLPAALLGSYVTYEGRLGGRRFWLAAGALLAAAAIAALLLLYTPIGHKILNRFNEVNQDLRPQLWKATIVGIREYWPAGSGIGSFVPVYRLAEDLNYINTDWVNHAHNEYLELVMEGGVAVVALMLLFAVLLALRMFARTPDWLGHHKWAAFTVMMILLLHSITDYPMRTFGLLSLFAFSGALLYPSRKALRVKRERSYPVDPQPDFIREPAETAA